MHCVTLQVRQAEMEGEYLEAKRQLLRTREKNLQVCDGGRLACCGDVCCCSRCCTRATTTCRWVGRCSGVSIVGWFRWGGKAAKQRRPLSFQLASSGALPSCPRSAACTSTFRLSPTAAYGLVHAH